MASIIIKYKTKEQKPKYESERPSAKKEEINKFVTKINTLLRLMYGTPSETYSTTSELNPDNTKSTTKYDNGSINVKIHTTKKSKEHQPFISTIDELMINDDEERADFHLTHTILTDKFETTIEIKGLSYTPFRDKTKNNTKINTDKLCKLLTHYTKNLANTQDKNASATITIWTPPWMEYHNSQLDKLYS